MILDSDKKSEIVVKGVNIGGRELNIVVEKECFLVDEKVQR